jgi:hypothetical protein
VAITTTELLELVHNCQGSGDVDFLREGVLAWALMDAEVRARSRRGTPRRSAA